MPYDRFVRDQIAGRPVDGQASAGRGQVAVAALHDLNHAARFCDHLVVLKDGGVIAQGPPETVLDPALLHEAYAVEARVERCSRGRPMVIADRPSARR
jgi:iron complex transport system ATP-binding protein